MGVVAAVARRAGHCSNLRPAARRRRRGNRILADCTPMAQVLATRVRNCNFARTAATAVAPAITTTTTRASEQQTQWGHRRQLGSRRGSIARKKVARLGPARPSFCSSGSPRPLVWRAPSSSAGRTLAELGPQLGALRARRDEPSRAESPNCHGRVLPICLPSPSLLITRLQPQFQPQPQPHLAATAQPTLHRRLRRVAFQTQLRNTSRAALASGPAPTDHGHGGDNQRPPVIGQGSF